MIRFTIPGEPQGKGRARIGRIAGHARMFTPAKTLAYEGLVAQMAQQAMAGAALLAGPVVMEADILFTVPRSASRKVRADSLAGLMRPTKKPDTDNVIKALCDGMNGVVWRDDVQVVELRVSKRFAEVPGVVVSVAPLQQPDLLAEAA